MKSKSHSRALSRVQCAVCFGAGLRFGRALKLISCGCVQRKIFTICHNRFRQLSLGRATLNRTTWGMKAEEYSADFVAIARRTLGEDSQDYKLFKMHFLLGAEWRPCAARLGMDRGTFFHAVYRIEEKLGEAYASTEPYPLFPLDEYFSAQRGAARARTAAA